MAAGGPSVWPGRPYPLGATWDGNGVNFALFSANAERVDLCIFDARGRRELSRVTMPEYTDQVWHAYLPEARPGTLYGYRVYGPYDPHRGHRFNPHKLLIDPYAKALHGPLRWSDAHFGYRTGAPRSDLTMDRRDNASGVPKAVVVDTAFTWGDEAPPNTHRHESIVYETHVRGLTARHPGVPPALRGTFAGLATPAVLEHLTSLGITAVELLPVHAFVDERFLVQNGLRNYWGYNTIGFFAPEARYLATGTLGEFKTMVRVLHDAGIEVILDVVYNHTAEGNQLGPTLSLRGIDNATYYRLQPGDPRHYVDDTGCGNTLNLEHPRVLQLVMDSLRYWAQEMHVDGFRFDLAPAICREHGAFDRSSSFLDAVRQDPVLSRLKLIAEPWDLGPDGYRLGAFPPGWSEWNDRFRDSVLRFWNGHDRVVPELAFRLTGSSDVFDNEGRRPRASVNFVTAHDGFTLRDLVSYEVKRNEANLQGNADGRDVLWNWNCGVEGETDDPRIQALRRKQQRNLLLTLLLAQGVPMLRCGDELHQTKRGNNNSYCQDNETSWLDWEADDMGLLAFVQTLTRLRREHPVFRRPRFFHGRPAGHSGLKDITWLRADGDEMEHADWQRGESHAIGFMLSGDPGDEFVGLRGYPEIDQTFVFWLNAQATPLEVVLPALAGARWRLLIDTSHELPGPLDRWVESGSSYALAPRSGSLLVAHPAAPGRGASDR